MKCLRSVSVAVICIAFGACSPSGAPGEAAPAAVDSAHAAAPASPAAAGVADANWDVQPGASSIGFSGTHAGNAFSGRFERFSATVRFDPQDLANAKALVTIETASARTGSKLQESSLTESDWFDVAKFPVATFESDSFVQTAPGQFEMAGQLTIKGIATPVRVPFTLSQAGTSATAKGRVELDRIALKIGVSSDAKAEWVSAKIPLEITLVANAKPVSGQ